MAANNRLTDNTILRLVQIALTEDVGMGDITSEALLDSEELGHAVIMAKAHGVIAGTVVAGVVFGEVDRSLSCDWAISEGGIVEPGEILGHIRGTTRSILTGERVALNFMQRMSGIATLTRRYVELVAGTGATILDTRKTIPAWRILDKYSVTIGGGMNHRMGLYDMVMIKDNHIAACGSIAHAVSRMKNYLEENGITGIAIEVETKNLAEVSEALSCPGIKRIMFDNFNLDVMRDAVVLVDNRLETEASGGVSLETVREIAETGVQYISVGALTHSAVALDISLDLRRA